MNKILLMIVVALFTFQLTSFASISITSNTADIKITPPGGKTITIKAGAPIPTIPDGSIIEVVSGSITVGTTDPSKVDLSILGNTVMMTSGNTIQISINKNGAIKVYDSTGKAIIKTVDGKTIPIKAGQTVIITKKKGKNAEGYTPPVLNVTPLDTQVQIEEKSPDISPV